MDDYDRGKLRIRRRTRAVPPLKPLSMLVLLVLIVSAIIKCSQLC
ncbi:MAG: hypothetical protein OSJ22_07895 [Rikenellaceae bacterium]|nr:hypothetical protein [Rikenellaceae bacterium]